MAVSSGDGNNIDATLHKSPDMIENPFPVELSKCVASCGNSSTADQTKLGIPRGFELSLALLRDFFHIAHRDESMQAIVIVHHKQLMNADILGKKLVRYRDWIIAEFLSCDSFHLTAWCQCLGNPLCSVARLHHMT